MEGTETGFKRAGKLATLACLALMTAGCGTSVRLVMPDVDQPVVMGSMVGPNVSLPPEAQKIKEVKGKASFERTEQYHGSYNTVTDSWKSTLQKNFSEALMGAPDRCVTNLEVNVVYRLGWNFSLAAGMTGDVYQTKGK